MRENDVCAQPNLSLPIGSVVEANKWKAYFSKKLGVWKETFGIRDDALQSKKSSEVDNVLKAKSAQSKPVLPSTSLDSILKTIPALPAGAVTALVLITLCSGGMTPTQLSLISQLLEFYAVNRNNGLCVFSAIIGTVSALVRKMGLLLNDIPCGRGKSEVDNETSGQINLNLVCFGLEKLWAPK